MVRYIPYIEESTLNLFEAVMQGNKHMRQAKLSLEKAKAAVETARKIIKNDPNVLSRKTNNIDELRDALSREKNESIDFPTILYIHRKEDSTPLHWVAMLGSHYEMAKLFIEKYPTASKEITSIGGSTPLNFACSSFFLKEDEIENKRILKLLLEVNPDALKVKDKYGYYPLHNLCVLGNANGYEDLMRLILKKFPEACKLRNNKGWLPLHIAIEHNVAEGYNNMELIKALLEYFPEGAFVRTKRCDNLPIHIALYHCFDNENDQIAYNIVKCILQRSDFFGLFEPFGTRELDPDEDEFMDAEILESLYGPPWNYVTPWRTICKKNGRDEALSLLEGIGNYHTIIHDAIGKSPINDICSIIDSKNIDLISSVDHNSNKAITFAIHEASKDENRIHWKQYFKPLIEMLFRRECMQQEIGADTEIPVSRITDRNGQHLLHVAAKEGLPWFCLEDILQSYVDAACVENVQSGLVPFMIAGEGSNSDLSAVFGVLRALPVILHQLNRSFHFFGDSNIISSIGRVDGKRQRIS